MLAICFISHLSTLSWAQPASDDCANTATLEVVVDGQLTPTFDNPGPICPNTNFILSDTSNEGIQGSWQPQVNNEVTTIYTFTPNAGECGSITSLTVEIDSAGCVNEPFVELPNIFTPNGDHTNDLYKLKENNLQSIEYRILNRWGNQVYFSDKLNQFWDGEISGSTAAEGVYFITYKAVGTNGKEISGQRYFHLQLK